MPEHDDSAAILRECVAGRPLRDVARSRGMTIPEVHRILDLEAERMFSPAGLRRAALLEAEKLHALKNRLFAKAMQEDDPIAANTFIRASERLAALIGINHPNGHIVTMANTLAPVEEESSTVRLLHAIRLLKNEHMKAIEQRDEQTNNSPEPVLPVTE